MLQLINTGVKSFVRCDNKSMDCAFRLAQEVRVHYSKQYCSLTDLIMHSVIFQVITMSYTEVASAVWCALEVMAGT
jgi:hypothetical protein